MAQLPRIGPKGAVWVLEMLRSGLSLGKRVAELVDPNNLQIWAVIGVDADAAAPEQFQGGLARGRKAASSVDKLAAVLCRDFGDADLIVEDPISLPSEIRPAFPTGGPPTMLACGREVYFACSLGGEIELVRQTLFSHDRSFCYNGFVVEGLPHDDAGACPTGLFHGADAGPDELPVLIFKSQPSLATSATHAHLPISRECCIEHSNPHGRGGSV
jgi:hypothetical protein